MFRDKIIECKDQELEDSERKAALFWLANTASDSAVAWFDDVLGE